MRKLTRCTKCGEEKKLSEFYRHSARQSGRMRRCKECTKSASLARYYDKRGEVRNAQREYYLRLSPEERLIRNAKARAKKLGLPCTITPADIPIPSVCPALGIPLWVNSGGKSGTANSPSLDRIVPDRGYVPGNVAVISKKANAMKQDATPEEVLMLSKWLQSITKGDE